MRSMALWMVSPRRGRTHSTTSVMVLRALVCSSASWLIRVASFKAASLSVGWKLFSGPVELKPDCYGQYQQAVAEHHQNRVADIASPVGQDTAQHGDGKRQGVAHQKRARREPAGFFRWHQQRRQRNQKYKKDTGKKTHYCSADNRRPASKKDGAGGAQDTQYRHGDNQALAAHPAAGHF